MVKHLNLNTAAPRRAVVITTAFVIFVCLALLGVDAWLALRTRVQEMRQVTVASSNLAAAVSQQMDSMFSEVGNILTGIVYELERSEIGVNSLGHLQPVLVNQATITRHIHDLFVFDAQGRWLVTSQADFQAGATNADRDYFIHHRSDPSAAAFIGKPVLSRSSGVWVIPVSKRFNDSNGQFAGVVLATIEVEYLRQLISEFDIGQYGALALMSKNGLILVRRPYVAADLGRNIAGSVTYQNSMEHGWGTFETISSLDGVERLVSYRHLKNHPMFVTVALSKHEMLQNWRATTSFQTAWILLLCGVTALAGTYVVRSVRERLRVEVRLGHTRDELTDANARLMELARYDGLTSLANRRYFDETLDQAFAQAARSRLPLALVMIDVDHFKAYNDLYGHPQGDRCLQQVAQAVQAAARRPRDFVARYGGEEIAMILPDTDAQGAEVVAETARAAVAALDLAHAGSDIGYVSISAGVAVHVPGVALQRSQDLLGAADGALYRAKKAGRNTVL
jgi:diguanylate cyclase (GGDEF)-like protein